MVRLSVDAARYRVRVFDRGVVFVGPLRAHEAEGDAGFAAAAVAADGYGYAGGFVGGHGGSSGWWMVGGVRAQTSEEGAQRVFFVVCTLYDCCVTRFHLQSARIGSFVSGYSFGRRIGGKDPYGRDLIVVFGGVIVIVMKVPGPRTDYFLYRLVAAVGPGYP